MVKKCIVEYDDNNNPIGIVELKEFTDIKSFKDFEELCRKNKEQYICKLEKAAAKAKEEKKALESRLWQLENNIIFLIKAVKKIFGVETVEEIDKLYKEVMSNEEES